MAPALVAVDGPVAHHLGAAAVVVVVGVDDALLQGHGHGDGLEDGAGLIGVAHRLVQQLLVVGLTPGHAVLLAVLPVFLSHRVQLLLEALGDDFTIAVGIKVRGAGHGQDGSGGRVHDDAEPALLYIIGLDALGQGLFSHGLDLGVDGQVQVVSLLAVKILLIAGEHLAAYAILPGDHPAGGPGEQLLIGGLQPLGSYPLAAAALVLGDESQHMGGDGGLGIVSLGGLHQVENGGHAHAPPRLLPVAGDEGTHLLRFLFLQIGGQDLIVGVGALQPGQEGIHILVQQIGQKVGHVLPGLVDQGLNLIRIRLAALILQLGVVLRQAVDVPDQICRRQDQVVSGGGHGQHFSLTVIDGPPTGVHCNGLELLAGCLLFPVAVLGDLQLPQLGYHGDEEHHSQTHHQKNSAPEEAAVIPSGGAPGLWILSGHSLAPLKKRWSPGSMPQGA